MLPLMVSRLPLGAGYDRCRRWGDLQAAQGQWMLDARLGGTRTLLGLPGTTLQERWPWPEASPWRQRRKRAAALCSPFTTRRALTTKSAHDARAWGSGTGGTVRRT